MSCPVRCLKAVQSCLNSSNNDGSFITPDWNSFFESLRNGSDSSRKQIFRDICLCHHEIVF